VSSKEEDGVVSRDIKVVNKLGFHARPAAMFAKLASQFDCDISVRRGETVVSGKSLMGLLSMEAGCGTTIHVTAEGEDAQEALERLDDLVTNGLEADVPL
jgi:phosphocarrier protein HPr